LGELIAAQHALFMRTGCAMLPRWPAPAQ